MCLYPRISRCAWGKFSRSSRMAGSVSTKSPMAPPRMTRMRGFMDISDLGFRIAEFGDSGLEIRNPNSQIRNIARAPRARSVPRGALRPLIEAAEHSLALPALRAVPGDGTRIGVILRLLLLIVGRAAASAKEEKCGGEDSNSGIHHRPMKQQISSLGRSRDRRVRRGRRWPVNRE